jgi:hypothetical protein
MASSLMPQLGGEGVPEPVRVDARDAGRAGDPADDAGDPVPVQGAAVVGDQPFGAADVLEVRGGPVGEEPGQLGVQRHVPVVAELAEPDAQPVGGADEDDCVGFQAGELAGPHPGPREQLHDQPVAGVSDGPGGGHQPGGVAVVEELRQRLGFLRDVPGDHGVAGRGVGPLPLDDPLEELAEGPDPLPAGLFRDRPACPGGGRPQFEVLDVIAADVADCSQPGLVGHPAGEVAQRFLGRVDAGRGEERAQLPQVAAHDRGGLGRGGLLYEQAITCLNLAGAADMMVCPRLEQSFPLAIQFPLITP